MRFDSFTVLWKLVEKLVELDLSCNSYDKIVDDLGKSELLFNMTFLFEYKGTVSSKL